MFNEVKEILKSIEQTKNHNNNIPPTMLYNEGWLLRLILNWFSLNRQFKYKIQFDCDAHWYSEALLSSKFSPKYRGDKLAESYTHADGVTGNFSIGNKGMGDLKLAEDCKQFIVIEAKMFSKYSKGTKNAPEYNQVARTVSCMCHIISQSNQLLSTTKEVKFYTFLPKEQLKNEPTFNEYIMKKNISRVVKDRVKLYKGRSDYEDKYKWFKKDYKRFIKQIVIENVSWEEIIEFIEKKDNKYYKKLLTFYNNCIYYNRIRNH